MIATEISEKSKRLHASVLLHAIIGVRGFNGMTWDNANHKDDPEKIIAN